VLPGYASAAAPAPGDVVRALRAAGHGRVVVATYLLSPGYFADKIRDAVLAAGAAAVSPVLGAAPEVAALVLDRYMAAADALSSPAAATGPASGPEPLGQVIVTSPLGICFAGGNRRGTDIRCTGRPRIT
jgi:sirohydrochlorin ferrochelatase